MSGHNDQLPENSPARSRGHDSQPLREGNALSAPANKHEKLLTPLTLAATEGSHYIGPLMELAQGADFDLLKMVLHELDHLPSDLKATLNEQVDPSILDDDFRNLVSGLEKLRAGALPSKEELCNIAYPDDTIGALAKGLTRIKAERMLTESLGSMADLLTEAANRLEWLRLHEKFMWACDIAEKYHPDGSLRKTSTLNL